MRNKYRLMYGSSVTGTSVRLLMISVFATAICLDETNVSGHTDLDRPCVGEEDGPQVPEPKVPEPKVPEPEVPEPSVPEPEVPEPSVPEPENPEPSVPEETNHP